MLANVAAIAGALAAIAEIPHRRWTSAS